MADVTPGTHYRVLTHAQGENRRVEIELAIGMSEVFDRNGRLWAAKPEVSPPEILAAKGGAAELPVSWHGYDRPTPGDKVMLTTSVQDVRTLKIAHPERPSIYAHLTGRRFVGAIDHEAEVTRARSRLGYGIERHISDERNAQGFCYLVWPGRPVGLEGSDPLGVEPSGPPDPAELVEAISVDRRAMSVTVRTRAGVELEVDPLDVVMDGFGFNLERWRRSQIGAITAESLDAARSALNHLVPDSNAGKGKCRVDAAGVFLDWATIHSLFIEGHERGGEALARVAEAALGVAEADGMVP